MTKKTKIKRKTNRKTSKKKSKEVLLKDKSIIWALVLGVVLAVCVIWYLVSD